MRRLPDRYFYRESHGGSRAILFVYPMPVKKPSAGALILGLVPFAGMCFSVALWDRVYPMILGLPFNIAWLLGWIVLTSLCLSAAYRIEMKHRKNSGTP